MSNAATQTMTTTISTCEVFFDFGFTPSKASEAIGKIVSTERAPDTYWHNVASYRQPPKWRKVSREFFHGLMNATKGGAL